MLRVEELKKGLRCLGKEYWEVIEDNIVIFILGRDQQRMSPFSHLSFEHHRPISTPWQSWTSWQPHTHTDPSEPLRRAVGEGEMSLDEVRLGHRDHASGVLQDDQWSLGKSFQMRAKLWDQLPRVSFARAADVEMGSFGRVERRRGGGPERAYRAVRDDGIRNWHLRALELSPAGDRIHQSRWERAAETTTCSTYGGCSVILYQRKRASPWMAIRDVKNLERVPPPRGAPSSQ